MKRVNRISAKSPGFTLLELLIVLAILIVIIGMLGTTVWSQYRRALVRSATIQVTDKLHNAVAEFHIEFGRYPTQAEGLYILAGLDNPNAPSMSNQVQQQTGAGANPQNTNMMNPGGTGMQGDFSGTGMQGMNPDGTGMQGDFSGMGMQGMNPDGTGMQGDFSGMGMQGMNPGMTGMQGDYSGMGMQGMNPGMTGMTGMNQSGYNLSTIR